MRSSISLLIFISSLLISCGSKRKLNEVCDSNHYARVTSADDSVKSMYVIYNCLLDTSYKMFRFYWDNGRVQTINFFFNKKKIGYWVGYFDNGKMSFQQNFEDDKREGDYKIYFMNGKLKTSRKYHNDKMIGVWSYYRENGSLLKVEDNK